MGPKNTGLAEVMCQYSHIGTVLHIEDQLFVGGMYLKIEKKDHIHALQFHSLKGEEITEKLDVGGEQGKSGDQGMSAFHEVMGGNTSEYRDDLVYAHSASYSTLMFK